MGYHLEAQIVSRGKGQSIVAKAAYNGRDTILERRTGELKDYTRMKDKPIASFVFVSDPELRESGKLWNFYDEHETRKNAQLGVSFIAALPHQLTDEQRAFIVKDFLREQFQRKGAAAQADIHTPDRRGDDRNFHVHILAGMKKIEDGKLGDKLFTWDDREKNLADWRQKWGERGARELEKAGLTTEAERWRYGYLPNEQQREKALERGDLEWADLKAREATSHLGPAASGMERRGELSSRGDLNRAAQEMDSLVEQREALANAIEAEQERLTQPPTDHADAIERIRAASAAYREEIQTHQPAASNEVDPFDWWKRTAVRLAHTMRDLALSALARVRDLWQSRTEPRRGYDPDGGYER